MKREIKFRGKIKAKDFRVKLAMAGKPKNEGEWTYGEVHLQSTIPHIHEGMDKYPIDVDTVGQFTGLKDKNGKEIYEGDIIRFAQVGYYSENPVFGDFSLCNRTPYIEIVEDVIVYEDYMFKASENAPLVYLGFRDLAEIRDYFDDEDLGDIDVDIRGTKINESLVGVEVIGNIYDNPELLTDK